MPIEPTAHRPGPLPAAAGHEQSPPPAGPPLPQSRAQFGNPAGMPPRRDGAPIAPSLRPSATTGSDVADFTRGLLTALLQDWEPGEVKTLIIFPGGIH